MAFSAERHPTDLQLILEAATLASFRQGYSGAVAGIEKVPWNLTRFTPA